MQFVVFFGNLANLMTNCTVNLVGYLSLIKILYVFLALSALLLEKSQKLGNELGGFDGENGG